MFNLQADTDFFLPLPKVKNPDLKNSLHYFEEEV